MGFLLKYFRGGGGGGLAIVEPAYAPFLARHDAFEV